MIVNPRVELTNSIYSFNLFSAAKLMGQAGSTVVLQVSKQAAVYHGLAALLSQPSPATSPRKTYLVIDFRMQGVQK